jgi:hypothetical protein
VARLATALVDGQHEQDAGRTPHALAGGRDLERRRCAAMDPRPNERGGSGGVHEQVTTATDADLGEQDGAIEDVPGGFFD